VKINKKLKDLIKLLSEQKLIKGKYSYFLQKQRIFVFKIVKNEQKMIDIKPELIRTKENKNKQFFYPLKK